MKRSLSLTMLLSAVVLLIPAFVVTGCGCTELSGGTGTTDTTSSVTSTTQPPETTTSSVAATTISTSATTEPPATTTTAALTTTRYEEDNPKLVWDGSWTFTGGADDSGGSCRYTDSSGSSVTIKFSGISFSFITRTGLAVGKVKITLDSGSPVLVDCYSATPEYQQIVWAADPLEPGTHYVKIECDGSMNPASGGTGIYVDAFAITGTLE
jgi:hypothetical protein